MVGLFHFAGDRPMDQETQKDALQQIKDLLTEQVKMQELILHRLERLEQVIADKAADWKKGALER
jgi:hypothetical protein